MNTDKDKIKALLNKIDNLEKKLNQIEDLLTNDLEESDPYLPYPSFYSNNSLDILVNTMALIIE